MTDLDALLAGIVANPREHVRWLIMADWLEDHGFPERAELVRVHRELLRTCTDPDAHPERPQLHARMMELMRSGVQPCLPQKTLVLPGRVELRMSFIPPGSFLMGSPESELNRCDIEPIHLATVTQGFWMGQVPVTQGQWAAIMGTCPSEFKGEGLPVEQVSWYDARDFCATVSERTGFGVRLPTEQEWEYACRAGTTTPFYWGTELNGTQANSGGPIPYGTETFGPWLRTTTEVGYYSAISPHPWELVDTIGNVQEWCKELFRLYPGSTGVEPLTEEEMEYRMIRGGYWGAGPEDCRAANRDYWNPSTRDVSCGFRIAADLE